MEKKLGIFGEYFMITIATIITGAGVFFFLMPSHLTVGSISGLAIVVANFVPLPVSAITMIFNIGLLIVGFLLIGREFGAKTVYTSIIFNIGLLIVGFLLIGREFGAKTVYTSILLPMVIGVFEKIYPNNVSITGDPFVDMICYIFTVSVGLAMLFNRNASSGGLDIIAKLMNKFMHIDLGSAMSLSGMAVAVSALFVYDSKTAVLSVLGTYLNGIVLDHFIFGFDMKKRVCIVSKKEAEIRDYILNDLHSGATIYEAYGAYNLEKRREIITIVDKNEYAKLMTFIEKTDSEAFVTIYTVNKIIYRPKV